MKKRMITAVTATVLGIMVPLMANDLYTSTYMMRSGVVSPHVGTGIPDSVSIDRLMTKRIGMRASIYFKKGQLLEESAKALDEIVAYAREHHAYVSVIGHIDSYTKEDQFVPLSFWASLWQGDRSGRMSETVLIDDVNGRIHAVYDLLVSRGVSPGRIYTENRMDRDPLTTEATSRGRALNRRVDVRVYH